jgi:hypothetical protein
VERVPHILYRLERTRHSHALCLDRKWFGRHVVFLFSRMKKNIIGTKNSP